MALNIINRSSGKSEDRDIEEVRERLKGILYQNETDLDDLWNGEVSVMLVNTTVDELEKLSDLECFVEGHKHSKTLVFAKRWNNIVDTFVRIKDDESEIEVEIKQVVIEGDITNEVVREFSRNFGSNTYTTFDPMAERHDEPHLSIHPW